MKSMLEECAESYDLLKCDYFALNLFSALQAGTLKTSISVFNELNSEKNSYYE